MGSSKTYAEEMGIHLTLIPPQMRMGPELGPAPDRATENDQKKSEDKTTARSGT
jgi:hypothetical protein